MSGPRSVLEIEGSPRAPVARCAAALLVLLALLSPLAWAAKERPGRIVAVADIHGDFDAFVGILQEARLINERRRWIGRNATLVQTGDFLDRGPESRKVMDLLMALEKQAGKKKGQVIVLLGNHEMMNLTGDLRYVSGEEYAAFADEKSLRRQREAYQVYVALRKGRAEAWSQPAPEFTAETEGQWMESHPPGFVEHRRAFGPAGKYGRWLRQRPAVARVGEVIFLHGGISPALASWKIEAINKRMREEMKAFDGYRQYLEEQKLILPFFRLEEMTAAARTELEARKAEAELQAAAGEAGDPAEGEQQHLKILEDFLGFGGWLSFHPEGPLWFRGFALWPRETGAAHVAGLRESFGASAFVVGHTPQPDGLIHSRFDGQVFLADTGMLARYYEGGRASALEIENGRFSAIYLGERTTVLEPVGRGSGEASRALEAPPLADGRDPAAVALDPSPLDVRATSPRVWWGPEGEPLPFASDEQVLEFLRTARVVQSRELGEGITLPRQVVLEKDGIRMRAHFNFVDEAKNVATFRRGPTELGFRDSYLFNCAAYELGRLLGLENVPPVVIRKIAGKRGSLSVWIENAMTETTRLQKKKIRPPDAVHWNKQTYVMRIFDALIYNTDRNLGNILIDPDWKLWMIDHTRAFRRFPDLENPKAVVKCERHLWERLQSLDEAEVRERLKGFLRGNEIKALFQRRDKLVERIQELIKERGEQAVLYTLD